VTRVVDGDTIRVRLDSGGEEPIRYIGMDTPEQDQGACYDRANDANRALVEGERVRLEYDEDRRDRYDRLLAYVYVPDGDDETFVNEQLVRDGFADDLYVSPNGTYRRHFDNLAARARNERRGLWAGCPEVPF